MIKGITFINILVNAASQNITMLVLLGFIPKLGEVMDHFDFCYRSTILVWLYWCVFSGYEHLVSFEKMLLQTFIVGMKRFWFALLLLIPNNLWRIFTLILLRLFKLPYLAFIFTWCLVEGNTVFWYYFDSCLHFYSRKGLILHSC